MDLSLEITAAGLEERALEGRLTAFGARTPASVDDQVESARQWRDQGDVQSPQLWWPEDRSWVVATEIDFDSTIVAGARELIAALLAADQIETLEVGPDTSLQFDADTVKELPQ